MHPNDTRAGSDLANILVQNATAVMENSKQSIIALSGSIQSQASSYRVEGLHQRVAGDRNLALNHIYNTTWTRENAANVLEKGLKSYPDTTIVWTVSDELALGSLQVLKANGRKPGQDIFVGSFDWSAEGLQAVKDGDIVASMGGHFMEAGWALVMLYDYHNNKDFKDDTGVEIVTVMESITRDNIDTFLHKLGKRNWNKVDFRKFTKTNNPALKSYDFSLDAIFAGVESSRLTD
jgi:ABC-type sugar transport system substrate-binding protein